MKNRKFILFLFLMMSNSVIHSQDSIYFELVKDIYEYSEPSQPHSYISLGDKFVFAAEGFEIGTELYVSDGTEEGTALLKDINYNTDFDIGSNPSGLTKFGDKVIFSANHGFYGNEPWITDGTTAGTHMLKNISGEDQNSNPSYFYQYNDQILFSSNDMWPSPKLFITDGTEENTVKLQSNTSEDVEEPRSFYEYNDIVYFSAEESSYSRELWRTDGTEAGTYMLKDLSSEFGGSSPSGFIEYNNLLFFAAKGDTTGIELWVTDGTADGTYIYKNINETSGNANGSGPSHFTIFDDKMYFIATDGINGRRIWVTDGDTTHITLDLFQNDYSYDYTRFFKFNDLLLFNLKTTEFGDRTLWVSDGTLENTFELEDNNNLSIQEADQFIKWNNKAYFLAQKQNTANNQVWVTDGTSEYTKQLFHDSIVGWSPVHLGAHSKLFLFNSALFINANYDSSLGHELYKIIDPSTSDIENRKETDQVINIYPNPTSEKITLNFDKIYPNAIITIFDVNGKSLYKSKLSNKIESIDISNFSKGVYVVVVSNEFSSFSTKFVVD